MGPQGDLVTMSLQIRLSLTDNLNDRASGAGWLDQYSWMAPGFHLTGPTRDPNSFGNLSERIWMNDAQSSFLVGNKFLTLSDNLNYWLDPILSLVDEWDLALGCAHLGQNWLDAAKSVLGLLETLSDAMTLTDASGIEYGLQITDGLSLSDQLSIGYGNLVSDQIILTDSFASVLGGGELDEVMPDQLVLSDEQAIGYGDLITDTMTLSDSVVLLFTLSSTFSETLTITDAVGLGYGFQIADTGTLSDNFVLVFGIVELFSDQLSFSDSIAIGYGNAVTDQLSFSDSVVIGYGDQVTDTMSLSDSLKIGYGLLFTDQMSLADSMSFQLLGALISLFLSDTLTMSDALGIGYGEGNVDQLTFSDSSGVGYGDLISDVLSLTDSAKVVLGQNELLVDTITFSDSLKIGYGLLFTDQLTMSDAMVFFPGWAPGDQMVFVEQVGIGYGMFISDSLNNWLEIFQSGQPAITLILTDQMSFSESLGAGYGCLVKDQGSMADQASFLESMLLLIADATPTQLDALQALLTFGLQVNDVVVFQEQLTTMWGMLVGTESLVLSDQLNISLQYALALALSDQETAAWLDAVITLMVFSPGKIVLSSLSVLGEIQAQDLKVGQGST